MAGENLSELLRALFLFQRTRAQPTQKASTSAQPSMLDRLRGLVVRAQQQSESPKAFAPVRGPGAQDDSREVKEFKKELQESAGWLKRLRDAGKRGVAATRAGAKWTGRKMFGTAEDPTTLGRFVSGLGKGFRTGSYRETVGERRERLQEAKQELAKRRDQAKDDFDTKFLGARRADAESRQRQTAADYLREQDKTRRSTSGLGSVAGKAGRALGKLGRAAGGLVRGVVGGVAGGVGVGIGIIGAMYSIGQAFSKKADSWAQRAQRWDVGIAQGQVDVAMASMRQERAITEMSRGSTRMYQAAKQERLQRGTRWEGYMRNASNRLGAMGEKLRGDLEELGADAIEWLGLDKPGSFFGDAAGKIGFFLDEAGNRQRTPWANAMLAAAQGRPDLMTPPFQNPLINDPQLRNRMWNWNAGMVGRVWRP